MRHPRLGRSAFLIGAAFALSMAVTGPAWADTKIPLHQDNVTAAGFGDQKCDHVKETAGKDGWVFVLPKNKSDFVSLTLVFKTPSGTTTLHVPPDGTIINDKGTSKAVVQTPAGWTLLKEGSFAMVSGEAPEFFNLSHTCPAPSASPSPSPSESSGGGGGSNGGGGGSNGGGGGSNGGGSGGSGGGSGSLPVTGSSTALLLAVGAALVAGGCTLLAVRRRRRAVQFRA